MFHKKIKKHLDTNSEAIIHSLDCFDSLDEKIEALMDYFNLEFHEYDGELIVKEGCNYICDECYEKTKNK